MDIVAINYSRDVGWAGVLAAEICRAEPSTVLVTFNDDRRPEIGVYRVLLPDEKFREVLDKVRRSGYEKLPSPAEAMPEAKFVVVGERRQGEALPVVRVFDVRAVPSEVSALGQEIEKVIVEIRQHPDRVIEGSASWAQSSFDPNEPLEVHMGLRCAGALPLRLWNPLGTAPGAWSGLRLWVRDASGKEQSVDLAAGQLRPSPGMPTDPTPILVPGDSVSWVLKKKVYLTPGRYTARLSYQNVIDRAADPQFVRGEMWLDLGVLMVGQSGGRR